MFINSIIDRDNEIETIHEKTKEGFKLINLVGAAGIGKTMLAQSYAQKYKNEYDFVQTIEPYYLMEHIIRSNFNYKAVNTHTLLIIDDADYLKIDYWSQIFNALREFKDLIILATSRRPIDIFKFHEKSCEIIVDSLSRDEILHFYETRFSNHLNNLNTSIFREFCEITRGNPALMQILADAIEKGVKKDTIKLLGLRTIVDTQGNPIRNDTSNTIKRIENQTIYVSKQMMHLLADNPDKMYELTPREFEKMIAELYQKLGYSVELTKQTRDGGKDIYLAYKNDIGSFLYLVECKKYAKDNPVGVGIVRGLYGVQALESKKVTGSIIATTSYFTSDAKQYIMEKQIQHQMSLHDFDYISKLLKKAYQ